MPVYNATTELPLEMTSRYTGAETLEECGKLLEEFGATIRMYTSNDDSTDDPEEFNYSTAMKLHKMNTDLHMEHIQRLAPSHKPATIEASKSTTTTQDKSMNSTISIESMTLTQLAELQIKVATRMQQLINETTTVDAEIAAAPEEVIDEAELAASHARKASELKGASRVKKSNKKAVEPAPKVDPKRNAEVAAAVAKTDEIVRNQLAEKANNNTAEPKKADLSTMKYADLRSFISQATKSSAKAKEIAVKVAAQRGQKSWATVGRAGYEEIYNLITTK